MTDVLIRRANLNALTCMEGRLCEDVGERKADIYEPRTEAREKPTLLIP